MLEADALTPTRTRPSPFASFAMASARQEARAVASARQEARA
jgi:hypothetical protein